MKGDIELEVAITALREGLLDAGEQVVEWLGDVRFERGDFAGLTIGEVKGATTTDAEFPVGGAVVVDGALDQFGFFQAEHASKQRGEGDVARLNRGLELSQRDWRGAAQQGGQHEAAALREAQTGTLQERDEFRVSQGGGGSGRSAGGKKRRHGRERIDNDEWAIKAQVYSNWPALYVRRCLTLRDWKGEVDRQRAVRARRGQGVGKTTGFSRQSFAASG